MPKKPERKPLSRALGKLVREEALVEWEVAKHFDLVFTPEYLAPSESIYRCLRDTLAIALDRGDIWEDGVHDGIN